MKMADRLPLDVNELAVRDMDTDQLARLRAALLAALTVTEAALHVDMRRMREGGATLQEIIAASGYRSIDGVRKILDPAVKRGAADSRTRRRRNSADVAKLV